MGPATLNRALVLEDPVLNPDGAGGFVQSWVALGTIWADLRAATGREGAEQLLTRSSVRYLITVRGADHSSPRRPRPEQRFRDGDRIFRIQAVKEADAYGRFLICHAEEEVAA